MLSSNDTIACIGAGNIGRAWAIVFARTGHLVRVYDPSADALANAGSMLASIVEDLVADGQLTSAAELMQRIQLTNDLTEAVDSAVHIQECAPERLDVKRLLFAELDERCPSATTLASSTSELLPSSFLDVQRHPERCMVAHPVNPPSMIPLVELCPAPKTSQQHMDRVKAMLTRCGMSVVTMQKEISGFILNRIQAAVLGEAFSLIDQGYCSPEEIDRVMTEGLARRWAFIGPLMTGHLNASAGYSEYIALLGPTWQKLIDSMRDNVQVSSALVETIVADMTQSVPVDAVSDAQRWRDRRLMALNRHLDNQPSFEPERPSNSSSDEQSL